MKYLNLRESGMNRISQLRNEIKRDSMKSQKLLLILIFREREFNDLSQTIIRTTQSRGLSSSFPSIIILFSFIICLVQT